MPTAYELERAANIARNKALLEELDLKEAVASLGIPAPKGKVPAEKRARPVQPARRAPAKRESGSPEPRRQSARLRRTVAPDRNETPAQKRKREKEEAEREAVKAEERLLAEETARLAKRPRHHDLDYDTLADNATDADALPGLRMTMAAVVDKPYPRVAAERDAFTFDDDAEDEEAALAELRTRLQLLRVVARAKVTQDRIYSAAYHPDPTKDLLFFGDKHGQLGIWDARAAPDEGGDDDEREPNERESGRYWRLQVHWPATSKSSISSLKLDPVDAHSIYTSSYDCTVRHLSFTSGISREVLSLDDTLISGIDLAPTGRELWVSDTAGGLTHVDLRAPASAAHWYGLSDAKIGCVSVNPAQPHLLLTSSNNKSMKIWDARKLRTLAGDDALATLASDSSARRSPRKGAPAPAPASVARPGLPVEHDQDEVDTFLASKPGKDCMRGDWRHGKAVGAAYWDPRGRSVVSTSYDDTLRLWDLTPKVLDKAGTLPSMRPSHQLKHDCQTGRWLTPFKAQWSPNPDAYPHFTIGNMKHSLDIFSAKGDLLARLADRNRISAVQAVTVSHPSVVERAASGNGSGRCVLWAPPEDADEAEGEEE